MTISMEPPHTPIRYITDQAKGISIRARVNMLWHVPSIPHTFVSHGLHMILMDVMGDIIEATVKDFVGTVTAVSRVKSFVSGGQRGRVIGIELCNDHGSFDCLLLDNYIEEFLAYTNVRKDKTIIMLMKLAKPEYNRGYYFEKMTYCVSLDAMFGGGWHLANSAAECSNDVVAGG
ncbi:hypothetical protein RIF29_20329 [Crotalaria pallida]|uniref:Uncharacterized protein n=1 Tax=Crotalaria pallida TaxID=3830 RepID=A0AAN9F2C1_CROPI